MTDTETTEPKGKVKLPARLEQLEEYGRMEAFQSIMEHFKEVNPEGLSTEATMWITFQAMDSMGRYLTLQKKADAEEQGDQS